MQKSIKKKITNPITQEKASTVSECPVGHLFKHVCRWEDGWMKKRKEKKNDFRKVGLYDTCWFLNLKAITFNFIQI